MKKSFITFWKDTWELQKASNRFTKKHWKGYIVLSISGVAIGCMLRYTIEKVINFIETKKEKSEDEES